MTTHRWRLHTVSSLHHMSAYNDLDFLGAASKRKAYRIANRFWILNCTFFFFFFFFFLLIYLACIARSLIVMSCAVASTRRAPSRLMRDGSRPHINRARGE